MSDRFEEAKVKAKDFGTKVWEEAKQVRANAIRFADENKELVIASVPVVIALVKTGQSRVVNKRMKDERKRIDHTYYDPSTGMHWELRRKATNHDRAEIIRRKANGQDTYTILRQMGLIR